MPISVRRLIEPCDTWLSIKPAVLPREMRIDFVLAEVGT